ncbi:twin arginine translocase protein A [Dermatophilus congolensis]|uniref:Sec-independent protein translocase protein TatA n=2 Tax=Dermatophilus congolensis TaxID=1863 RepID=A0AA46BMZ4_9MICO|nr:twin arginine translocase protein A [Dermatophilus congolensis]
MCDVGVDNECFLMKGLVMPSWLGGPEALVIIVVIVVLFGWKKLPDAARSLGRSMRIFKSEVDELKRDHRSAASQDTVHGDVASPSTTAPQQPQQAAPREPEQRPSAQAGQETPSAVQEKRPFNDGSGNAQYRA